jgi:hypothetical protein
VFQRSGKNLRERSGCSAHEKTAQVCITA